MSEIGHRPAEPSSPPPGVYDVEHPGASLAICATVVTLVIGTFPVLFLFGVFVHRSSIGLAVTTLLGILWALIPLGGVIGIRFGLAHLRRNPGNVRAWLGIISNGLCILFAALMWMAAFFGISE